MTPVLLRAGAIASLSLLVASCQTVETYLPNWQTFGIYKLDINQGNYITQDMVDKLKVGMTQPQVQSSLGTPMLSDPFHADRWDYIYRYTRHGKLAESRDFRVYFADQKLARWEGDEAPKSAAELNRAAAERTLGRMPSADDKGFIEKFFDLFTREPS